MLRRAVLQCLVLLLALGLIAGIYVTPSLAQGGDESITITTYYPSPYGSYNELQTNKFAVGDTDGLGTLDEADQPAQVGDIRLKVYSGNPQTNGLEGKAGEILFSSENDGSLFLHNGSAWVAQGGGSGIKSIQRGKAQFTIPPGVVSYGSTSNIHSVDIDLSQQEITITNLAKTNLKIWFATDLAGAPFVFAPILTSATNLRIYVVRVAGDTIICQVTYEIIEYE